MLELLLFARGDLRCSVQGGAVLVVEDDRGGLGGGGDRGEAPDGAAGLGLLGHMPQQRVDGHLIHLGGLIATGVAHARDEVVDALLVQGLHAVVVPGQVVRAVLLQ